MRARASDAHPVAASAMIINTRTARECDARHTRIANAPIAMGTATSQGPTIDKTVDPIGDMNGRP